MGGRVRRERRTTRVPRWVGRRSQPAREGERRGVLVGGLYYVFQGIVYSDLDKYSQHDSSDLGKLTT